MIRNYKEYRHGKERISELEVESKEFSKGRRSAKRDKVASAVIHALRMQIWDLEHEISGYEDLKERLIGAVEGPGTCRQETRLNSQNAAATAEELTDRLERRRELLDRERQISALPPVVRGGAIIVPGGQVRKLAGEDAQSLGGPDILERHMIRELFS
jgi:hypothetical protein